MMYSRQAIKDFERCAAALVCGLLLAIAICGCDRKPELGGESATRVVVYCSIDETFARDILARFQRNTGIEVSAIYDSEAGKTTGLVNRLIREAQSGRPGADVFWSGELFGTMHLRDGDGAAARCRNDRHQTGHNIFALLEGLHPFSP